MDYNERIEQLKEQSEQAKTLFLKCQGAIEVLEGLLAEENEKPVGKGKKK